MGIIRNNNQFVLSATLVMLNIKRSFALLMLVGVATNNADTGFQKFARKYALDDPEPPALVHQQASPQSWDHPESGPVPGLRLSPPLCGFADKISETHH